MCNAAGMCVGCLMDSDCPLPANECQTRVCNSGTCGVNFVTQGMLVSAQTAGDCKQNVCDGAGNIDVAIDNNDKPSTAATCACRACAPRASPRTQPATRGNRLHRSQHRATQCDGSRRVRRVPEREHLPRRPRHRMSHGDLHRAASAVSPSPTAGTLVSTQTLR